MKDLVIGIVGIIIILGIIFVTFKWFAIYLRVKGQDFKTFIATGFKGLVLIKKDDSEFDDEDRKSLNILSSLFYGFWLLFAVLFVFGMIYL